METEAEATEVDRPLSPAPNQLPQPAPHPAPLADQPMEVANNDGPGERQDHQPRAERREVRPRAERREVRPRANRDRGPGRNNERNGQRRDLPPIPQLPTWGRVDQNQLLRLHNEGRPIGKLRTRRRRQSRARKRLREQGVDPEDLFYRYEWRNRPDRRRV